VSPESTVTSPEYPDNPTVAAWPPSPEYAEASGDEVAAPESPE
jgi:hypothetical protein